MNKFRIFYLLQFNFKNINKRYLIKYYNSIQKNQNMNKIIQILTITDRQKIIVRLETFSVDNRWARFIIFLLADPHLLEGGEGSKDGSSNPYRVLPFWWSNDLDLHGWWGKSDKFLLHSVINSWVHCGASRQDGVGVQVLSNINITFHD